MTRLQLLFRDNRREFTPGETLFGEASWNLSAPGEAIELRLCWHTSGKGNQDIDVVKTIRWDNPEVSGQREFTLQLPDAPYSFSGKLISLVWSLELVALPSRTSVREDFSLSPTSREILLHPGPPS